MKQILGSLMVWGLIYLGYKLTQDGKSDKSNNRIWIVIFILSGILYTIFHLGSDALHDAAP